MKKNCSKFGKFWPNMQNMQNEVDSFYRKFSEMKKELGYALNRAIEKNMCFHINPNLSYNTLAFNDF